MSRYAGRPYALLVAGGTGGHVYPAVAVADALVARGHAHATLRFVTDRRTVARAALARTRFVCDELPIAHGLDRRARLANVAVVARAAWSTLVALRLMARLRPRVVAAFGAYVSLPVVVAARCWRVPVIVHEQNRTPGLANRVAVRLRARAAVSIDDTPLRGAVLTGNPVRPEIVAVRRSPQTPPLVAFVGASLGAGALNEVALALYDLWRDRSDVAMHHVTGERNARACEAALARRRRDGDRLEYTIVGYEHEMAALYARATIVVGRAGGSVAELAVAGVPSVLVPWTGAADDHQRANATAFERAGAAVHLPEAGLSADRLAELLDALLGDPARLTAMSEAARALGRPDAAERVADMMEAAAGGR